MNSKIIDESLNLCGQSFPITFNSYKEEGFENNKVIEKGVDYWDGNKGGYGKHFFIGCTIKKGSSHYLQIIHSVGIKYSFCFPLKIFMVKKQPLLCFNKWMEIAINDRPLVEQEAEFDNFLERQKEAFELKFKMEYLRRSSDRRPSSSESKSIISDEYLRSEIYQNGTRHL